MKLLVSLLPGRSEPTVCGTIKSVSCFVDVNVAYDANLQRPLPVRSALLPRPLQSGRCLNH